jgi:hypothetical protein
MSTKSFLIILYLLPLFCIGQMPSGKTQKFVVIGNIKIDKDGKGDIKDATLTLIKDSVEILKIFEKNHYELKLEFNSQYLIKISKPNYVTKEYLILTNNIPKERIKDGFDPYEMTNTLQKQPNDSVFTYTQPIGTIYFEKLNDDFLFPFQRPPDIPYSL